MHLPPERNSLLPIGLGRQLSYLLKLLPQLFQMRGLLLHKLLVRMDKQLQCFSRVAQLVEITNGPVRLFVLIATGNGSLTTPYQRAILPG